MSSASNSNDIIDSQLQEPEKFYRRNVVYRSFRSVGLQAMKNMKKNIGKKLENNSIRQKMQYRVQLDDSIVADSPLPKRRAFYRNKACPSLNSSAFSNSTCSELEVSRNDSKTPSKRKLISKKSTLRKSFRKQLLKSKNQRKCPKENVDGIDKEIEAVNGCLKDLAKLDKK